MKSTLPVSVRWEQIMDEALTIALGFALRRVVKHDPEYPMLTEKQTEILRETLISEFWFEFWERFRLEGEE